MDHFDGELVLVRQGEEAPGDAQHVVNEALLDPVAGQVKETDLARRGSQRTQKS